MNNIYYNSNKIEQDIEFNSNNTIYDLKVVENYKDGVERIIILKQKNFDGELINYYKSGNNKILEIREYDYINYNMMKLNYDTNSFILKSDDLCINELKMFINSNNHKEILLNNLINTKRELIYYVLNKTYNTLKDYEIINDLVNILNVPINEEIVSSILSTYKLRCKDLNKVHKLNLRRG